MGQYRYITKRIVQNKAGEEKGNILVAVKAGSENADVKYACPECQNSVRTVVPWKRPFSVRCGKCGFLMRLPKLKGKK
jgi:ribosomal protein S27E